LILIDVDVMPMPRDAARRLGEALIKAAED
jgi:hypothetical protein